MITVNLKKGQFGGSSGYRKDFLFKQGKEKATLICEYYFEKDFDPRLAGKLFGINSNETCTRIMFRRDKKEDPRYFGAALYVQDYPEQDLSGIPGYKEDKGYGTNLYQYYFNFRKGAWNYVKLECTMNSIGKADGIIEFQVGRNTIPIKINNFIFRRDKKTLFSSILGMVFFGGSSMAYAPLKDETIKIRILEPKDLIP